MCVLIGVHKKWVLICHLRLKIKLITFDYSKNEVADLKLKSRQLISCMPESSTAGAASFFVGEYGRAGYYVFGSQHHHFTVVMTYVKFEL